MKKILIIPHQPDMAAIKIRLIEIAKAISKNYDVYLVNWKAAECEYSLLKRIYWALRDLFTPLEVCRPDAAEAVPPEQKGRLLTGFTKTKLHKQNTLSIIKLPILHRPWYIAPGFNYLWLKNIINKEKIDVVINGSYYMFNIPQKRSFKYIYDIADLPETFNKSISRQIDGEIKKADKVTTASQGLAKYVLNKYNKSALFIPNGADVRKLRSVKEEEVDRIRRRYNLTGKWIIGYIGNIGPWVNVEIAVEAFHKIESLFSDAVLIWIGVSHHINDLKKRYEKENLIFTGGIEKQNIEPYFKLIDLGILPKRKCPFQDLAFHIKEIEYTAAGKFVISTPLEEMILLNFPNCIFVNEDKNAWVEAIKRVRSMSWDKKWDNLADEYDWTKISQKMVKIIED